MGGEVGSSPRVRSRRLLPQLRPTLQRIISACAEQTVLRPVRRCRMGDHLRVCGADRSSSMPSVLKSGSSPRVRSRLHAFEKKLWMERIISACAEQTSSTNRPELNCRDHLRVCGADLTIGWKRGAVAGSSPRVRSRHGVAAERSGPIGIISACAEQTTPLTPSRSTPQDHLRVCGADLGGGPDLLFAWGSSPRVRSRHPFLCRGPAACRIISACAEQTD